MRVGFVVRYDVRRVLVRDGRKVARYYAFSAQFVINVIACECGAWECGWDEYVVARYCAFSANLSSMYSPARAGGGGKVGGWVVA